MRSLRERILMLLLLNDGKTYQEIADFLGLSLRRVAYWCVHGDPDNLATLEDGRKKGNNQICQEWEFQGNNPQELREKGPKIVIIDDASFHKKPEFLDKIESELPKIKLEFLPPYSP